MMVKIRFVGLLLLISIFLSTTKLDAQNEDRRHWKYVADMSNQSSGDDFYNLKAKFWTGACYIGDGKAVTFIRGGELFLFDYDKYQETDDPYNSSVWSKPVISGYYLMNSSGERSSLSGRTPPDDLVGNSLAYVGDNKILLGTGRDSGVTIKETWVFDLTDNSWTLMLDETGLDDESVTIPQTYDYAMCHLVDDKVLAFGGKNAGGTLQDGTYIYDLSNNEWTEITSTTTPTARSAQSITSLGDGLAIMFGGLSGSALGETWIFDYNDGEPIWTQLVFPDGPGARYYCLLQKLSTDIAILYGGTSVYNMGNKHYNDIWRFNYDRDNKTGEWSNISLSDKPSIYTSVDKDDYLYYPENYEDPDDPTASFPNDNYRNIDGESINNNSIGDLDYDPDYDYGYGGGDQWGLYHGKRRSPIGAFLGNDRILLHGGGSYTYNGSTGYSGSKIHSKTYVFDLGIPDIDIDDIVLDSEANNATVYLTIGQINDDRGESLDSSTITVYVMYQRTVGDDDSYVTIPVTVTLSDENSVQVSIDVTDLPPNTEVEFVAAFDVEDFGSNNSDPFTITTGGGDNSLHLVNSGSDGVSGNNDYLIQNSAEILDLTSGFTISQWIKLGDDNSILKLTRDLVDTPILIAVTDEQIFLNIEGTSCSAAALDLSESWYHIAFVFDPTADKQRIYLDGYQVAEVDNTSDISSNLGDIVFDVKQNLNIDEFQIWDVALTETQIKEMLYQPIYYSYPDEVHGSVDFDQIDDLLWSDLKVYYKADYLDKGTPFSSTTKGCICQITGALGMSLVNTVESTTTEAEYISEPDLPYINWRKDAADDNFYSEDNWFSGMVPEPDPDPTILDSYSFQAIVVNVNTNGIYPQLETNIFGDLHTLVIRTGAKLYIDAGVTIPITKQLIYEGGGVVEVTPYALFTLGGDADIVITDF